MSRVSVSSIEHSAGQQRFGPWAAMAAIAVGVVIVGLDGTITAVANPVLASDLGASLAGLQWITNIYLLAMASTLVLAGEVGDRWGRRRVFLGGVFGFALSSAVIAVAPSVAVVIGGRLGQGLFGALIVTNAVALLRATFSTEALPKALATFSALIGASAATGPLIGGFLIEHTNWRWAFLINVPIAAIALLAGIRMLPQVPPKRGDRFDVVGAALLGVSLLSMTYALIGGAEQGWSRPFVPVLAALGLVLGACFVLVEKRARNPLLPLRLFTDRNVTIGLILSVMTFFALVGAMFFLLLFLQQINGDSPLDAGLHFLPLSIANVLASAACGRLILRFDVRVPLVGGMLLTAAGFALFTRVDPDMSQLAMVAPFVLLGLGVGAVMTASVQAVVGSAPVEDAAPAAGAQQTALQIGGILGTSALGAVMTAVVAQSFPRSLDEVGPAEGIALPADATHEVARGGVPAVADSGGSFTDALREASTLAFVDGMQATMWVGAFVCLIAAGLAMFYRSRPIVDVPASGH